MSILIQDFRYAVRSLLFDVSPVDPLSFMLAIGVLMLAAVIACLVPGRLASAIEPMTALRNE